MSFAVAQYRSTHTETASPVQIVVQLYDGAIRFMRQAQGHIESGRFAEKGVTLNKAHAIVSELQATLDHSHAPELCKQLDQLYDFVLFRVMEANVQSDGELLKAAIDVMLQLRGAWAELARKF
jgi:flagellar protein FliS